MASEFPEKFSQRMAELCGRAPVRSPARAPSAGHTQRNTGQPAWVGLQGTAFSAANREKPREKNLLSLSNL